MSASLFSDSATTRIQEKSTKNPAFRASINHINQQFSVIAKEAYPAIVNISTTRIVEVNQVNPFDFFFDSPFYDQQPKSPPKKQKQKQKSAGSGFLISQDGYILSNYHVIANSDEIKVILHNGDEKEAKLIGSDKKTDLALLKIKGSNYTFLEFGNSEKSKVGELVFAMGNPFSVGVTFTTGVISAKGRNNVGIVSYEDFIQTDAAINPGNSGGPLMNINGEVIGINTAIVSRSGGYQGIGFAIPVNIVKKIKNQLLLQGEVIRAYLGVKIQDLNAKFAKSFGLDKDTKGALLSDVIDKSPAKKGGLKIGDIITKVNGKSIKTGAELRNFIGFLNPNETITVSYIRDKKVYTTTIHLTKLKKDLINVRKNKNSFFGSFDFKLLTDSLKRQYGVPKQINGIVVTQVLKGGKSYQQGLRRGDVILKINNATLSNAKQTTEMIKAVKPPLSLLIYRNGSTFFSLIE